MMKSNETEKKLKCLLEKRGFIYLPNLSGNPHFAHFDTKIAVYLGTKAERMSIMKEWGRRFGELKAKGWRVIWVTKEDSVRKCLDRIMGFVTEREHEKYCIPSGPKPTMQKLMDLLKQTEIEIDLEKGKKRRNRGAIWGLKKRRRTIGQNLHHLLRSKILERDGYKCRACGSTADLELVRLYGLLYTEEKRYLKPAYTFEERWSEKNMFLLCKRCHTIFDSFSGRMWRLKKRISNIEDAIKLLRMENLSYFPPCDPIEKLRGRGIALCREAYTVIKVLNKAAEFQQQNNFEKAKTYLAVSKRELTYFFRRDIITQNQYNKFKNNLKLARENVSSEKEIDYLIEEIKCSVTETVREKVPPDVFSNFFKNGKYYKIDYRTIK